MSISPWIQTSRRSGVPSSRSYHAKAYNTAADRVILFGGQPGEVNFDFTDPTWRYDLNTNTSTNLTRTP